MTGRDLILYILSNNLEDEPIINDGSFVGFMTILEAAARLNVGIATIQVLMLQGKLDYVQIGYIHLIPITSIIKYERSRDINA